MSAILANRNPANVASQAVFQVSTVAAGDVSVYTVPAGRVARVEAATLSNITGTPPTVQLQLIRGASIMVLLSGTVAIQYLAHTWLLPGDVLKWRCTVGGAGSAVDATISAVEWEAA